MGANAMEASTYIVSAIVAVNAHDAAVGACVDSLREQTLGERTAEIILVPYGGNERTASICRDWALSYPNIVYREGAFTSAGSAWNAGIDAANGDYLVLIEADCSFAPFAFERMVGFIAAHEDGISAVAFRRTGVDGATEGGPLAAEAHIDSTGVCDLNSFPYAQGLATNFMVRAGFEWRFPPNAQTEDGLFFLLHLLSDTQSVGYMRDAECRNLPMAVKPRPTAVRSAQSFDTFIGALEDSFSQWIEQGLRVPTYIQAVALHECMTRFKAGQLWSWASDEDSVGDAHARVGALFSHVDEALILDYPGKDIYEKLYWIRLAGAELTTVVDDDLVAVYHGASRIYWRERVGAVLSRIRCDAYGARVRGFLKLPVFGECAPPTFTIAVNGQERPVPLVDCAAGYYKSHEKTDLFWGFDFSTDLEAEVTELDFRIALDGVALPMDFYNLNTVSIGPKVSSYVTRDCLVEQEEAVLRFTRLAGDEAAARHRAVLSPLRDRSIRAATMQALAPRGEERVWLYSDAPGVGADNGAHQFLHDISVEDGVARYYVLPADQDIPRLLRDVDSSHFVRHGSTKHVGLFFRAERLLVAYVAPDTWWPLPAAERKRQWGRLHAEIVSLQHGVVYAHLPWYYSKYTTAVDRVVVSTKYEAERFVSVYDFDEDDILPSGMARLDALPRKRTRRRNDAPRRILFAPSWRSYLLAPGGGLDRKPAREVLEKSSYLSAFREFLSHPALSELLERSHARLEYRFHPEFEKVYDPVALFGHSETVMPAPTDSANSEYDAIVTDISSLLFDFVYMGRPVVTFVPDWLELRAGLNHYNDFGIDPRDGFGEFTTDANSAIEALRRVFDGGFKPLAPFTSRYRGFFLDVPSHADALFSMLEA